MNFKWNNYEIMLVLDLYLTKRQDWISCISVDNVEILKLSNLFKFLDIYDDNLFELKNPSSICSLMDNFVSLDSSNYEFTIDEHLILIKDIWERYYNNIKELHEICTIFVVLHMNFESQDALNYVKTLHPTYTEDTVFLVNFLRCLLSFKSQLNDFYESLNSKKNYQSIGNIKNACNLILNCLDSLDLLKHERITKNIKLPETYAGINYIRIPQKNGISLSDEQEKIGRFVSRTFQSLVDKQNLSLDIITNLCSKEYCREIFGLNYSFLIQINKFKSIREQLVDINGHLRYWKKVYSINGQSYCVCKEWYANQRTKYQKWLATVYENQFQLIGDDQFVNILKFIHFIDRSVGNFSIYDIRQKFPNCLIIDEIIEYLLARGVLVYYQGILDKLIIEDYDLFYKLLEQ